MKKIEDKCLHPREMLITTYQGNIRCAKCQRLWIAEKVTK